MSAFVLDASIAAKWYLPGPQETLRAESLTLFDHWAAGRVRLAAPDLFWAEVANILWKAARTGRMSRRSAEDAARLLAEQEIPTYPSTPLLEDAFAIAAAFDRTVYDSLYVALAGAIGATLLTADERLVNALAARFPVRWLGTL
ncbi:MAG: type II toxin-antitoxin system VapC family toxin [Bryobacteraceae bacterium]|nr:type II toxin-antitoxin system VapC family toxin [Bryobacteraceae bacterium]